MGEFMSTLTPSLPGMAAIHPGDVLGRLPQSLAKSKRMAFHSPLSLPFYLHYMGAKWDGRLIEWKDDCAELRITGFPPIEISQHLHLQFFVQGQEYPWLQCQAVIQELKVEKGLSAWEGVTKIILNCRAWGNRFENLATGIELLPAQRTGNFLFGRVLEGSQGSSCTFQMPDRHHSTLPSFFSRSGEKNRELNDHPGTPEQILSSRLTIKKTNEQRIRAYHDRPEEGDQATLPVVVISPGYGETKRDYLTLAYYFASNGFQVIRYDHTNHVGESDGTHYHVSLSSMKDDLQTVTRFVRATWPHLPVIGVASSLASRVALKAEAECPSLSLLVMLMGIVNVQRSAATVHQEDVFAGYCDGQHPDSANILGFNVGSQFLGDAIAHKFVTVEQTLDDAKSLTSPVIVVSAGKDAWVAPEDLQVFRNALGPHVKNWIVVPEALHRLQENPKLARETYRQVVALCHEGVNMSPAPCVIRNPNRLDLGRQNRKEKVALQQQAMTEVGTKFWQDYLGHFQSVGKCPDYVKLLDHVFHALGPISPGQGLLDAGCGNGNAALFFLNTLRSDISSGRSLADPSIQYMGIDVVPEALRRANHAMLSAISELQQRNPLAHPLVKPTWAQVDLGRPLPFPDNQFDRIVSNLVLGYVHDPRTALSELYRVLAPGGRMVISNLKPDGDFSGIYQSLVSNVAFPQQREEARELLNNYGKIRQAEKEGQFCFFDRMEWESLVTTLGCVHAEIHPTFAGQAFLIVLEKPSISAQVSIPFIQNGPSTRNQGSGAGILKQVA
jgi:ubiquinone/menaquinone biosynthesis C-methylase UbiE/alpha-beta hydrolase superfamily lysophospholipase